MIDPLPETGPVQRPVAQQTVERLIRLHNLLLLIIVVVGLAAIMYVNATHVFPNRPPFMRWLTALRIILPLAALLLSFLLSRAAIERISRTRTSALVPIDVAAQAFRRAKSVTLAIVASVALFADLCLVVGHQTLDLMLAVFPLVIFIIMRPAHGNIEFFASLASQHAEPANKSE